MRFCGWMLALALTGMAPAQEPFAPVAAKVNTKVVKLYGSGGFRKLVAYGSGIAISSDGYLLTVSSHLLETPELRVHLSDGRSLPARVVVVEPELDAALLKIDGVDDLPHFDFAASAARPIVASGDWVLAFCNSFEIATRDEPVSVQRGVVAAVAKLPLNRGIFEAAFTGDVIVLDAVTNNPGAAGGALTTSKGELVGIVGKELRNSLTDTWINYAVPVQTRVEIKDGDKVTPVSLAEFVSLGMKGQYKPVTRPERSRDGSGGYHGIALVPNVVERTPPYIEEVIAGSPAEKAGLKPDDLIVYVDGEPIVSVNGFKEAIARVRAGQSVKLEVRRGDKLVPVAMTLEAMPK